MRRLLLVSLLPAGLALAADADAATRHDRSPERGRERAERDRERAERGREQAEAAAREAGERARAAEAEEGRLAAQRVAAAARLRETETEAAVRAAAVSDLAARRAATEARLKQHAAALAPLLPLVERLALFPAETLLAVPAPPGDALRGLGVLRGMARRLEQEAAGLRAEGDELARHARALEEALPGLQAVQAAQAEQAEALDGQLATMRALRERMEQAGAEAQRRAAGEAARADTLRAALATLEAERARAEAQARADVARAERDRREQAAGEARRREAALARTPGPGPEARAQLVQPVAGSIVRAWGEPTDAGPATGISYRPAPGARVVAPCGGRIRFSGPFRSYGALLILDCGGGYAFVLAGLERLDVAVGVAILPGEPVGAMPAWDAAGTGPRPALYVELRREGHAVNPAPFLRSRG